MKTQNNLLKIGNWRFLHWIRILNHQIWMQPSTTWYILLLMTLSKHHRSSNIDLIDSTSSFRLIISNLGKTMQHICIITDTAWPSWLHVVNIFLESLIICKQILVISPSLSCVNFFGTARDPRIKWRKLDFSTGLTPLLKHRLQTWLVDTDLILFSGSFPGLKLFTESLVPSTLLNTLLITIFHGKARLWQL